MLKQTFALIAMYFIAQAINPSQTACAAPIAPSPADKPVVKKDDGSVLMWEVPEKQPKVKTATPDDLRKINQAQYNQGAYLEEAANQNVLVAPTDGTAPGAITPPFLPYSTTPSGPYSGGGSVITPFNNRTYSYGGTSQSFGAPIFSGNEIPSPALGYPAGYPLGGFSQPIPLVPRTFGSSDILGRPQPNPAPVPSVSPAP